MSTANASDPVKAQSTASKGKKARKKKTGPKEKAPSNGNKVNGTAEGAEDNVEAESVEPETPTENAHSNNHAKPDQGSPATAPAANGTASPAVEESLENLQIAGGAAEAKSPPGGHSRRSTVTQPVLAPEAPSVSGEDEGTGARLEAMARERSALRDEVVQLRKSLEDFQVKHEEELQSVRGQLDDTREERDNAETQYRNLLGKVNTIKSQLGERLKADAEELSQARGQIEELQEANATFKTENEAREAEVASLAREGEERSKELSSLRNRLNLSQQNWSKEREDLIAQGTYAREEFESAKQAMQDWEVLAMEERSIRENLGEKVAELEEQLASQRQERQGLETERNGQAVALEGLQRALQEIQDARKIELREVVENTQTQIEELRKEVAEKQEAAARATTTLETTQKELERAQPFEMEAKEKNLLIGKLRHEAVILNDHLTKALKQLKRSKPDDTIDRQLVTNHFLHFLSLDRSDPRKFQILQIIAALLRWTEEQQEQAGLARPGASNPNLRTPISPWHRTPSTPSLSQGDLTSPDGRGRADSNWLDGSQAAESARGSRSTSVSSSRP